MIQYSLFFIGLLSIATVVAQKTKASLFKGMLLVMLVSSLAIYLVGMISDFMPAIYTLIVIMFASFIYVLYDTIRWKNQSFFLLNWKSYAIYMLIFIVGFYLFYGKVFSAWDEFSHWGLVDKSIFEFKGFPQKYPNQQLNFPGYPLILSIWQSTSTLVTFRFVEYYLMLTNYLLYMTLFLNIIEMAAKNVEIRKYSLYLILIISSVLVFNPTFLVYIYVDAMIGILLASAFIFYINIKEHKLNSVILCMLAVFLPLVKETGLFLFIIIFLVLAFCELAKKEKYNFLFIVFLIVLSFIGKMSWSLVKISEAWSTSELSLNSVIQLLKLEAAPYRYTIIKNFLNSSYSFFISNGKLQLTLITATFMVYLLLKLLKAPRKYIMVVMTSVIVFSLSLLILYVFTFSEIEGIALASYSRYLSTIFSFSFVVICYLAIKKVSIKVLLASILIVFLFLDYQTISFYYFKAPIANEEARIRRNDFTLSREIKDMLYGKRVMFITPGGSGYEYWAMKTELLGSELIGYSYGKPYTPEDVSSRDISEEDFIELITTVDYVFFFSFDAKFFDNFPSLSYLSSDDISGSIYKVNEECKQDINACDINQLLIKVN